MTDAPPPGGPDRDPFGQPVQTPPAQRYPAYPPQPWYPGCPPYPPGPPQPGEDAAASRTKAVWALVLAILPLCLTWIAAAVLAIMVLVGPHDGQRRGRGMAWASLVIVTLWTIGSVVLAVVLIASVPADRDDNGDITSGGEVSVEDLVVGDCLAEEFSGHEENVYTVSARPCDEPHNGEVFHDLELTEPEFPGDAEMSEIADSTCYQAFEPFVGLTYEDSELDFYYYVPTAQTWKYGDRLVTCVLISPEDVSETLQGSER